MHSEYHKWHSPRLGREMELKVYGHDGLPVIVYPTSCGSYVEFEDRGMVEELSGKIDAGQVQLYCLDSVDSESWYNRNVPPRWRIARHMQYEDYVMEEVVPLVRKKNQNGQMAALGCSFGGFHAASIALRHPDVFTAFLSMGGAFDPSNFLRGYYDQDCYFYLPTHFLPNMNDSWYLDRYRQNKYILATGVEDMCWKDNEEMASIMRQKGIPVKLDVWGDHTGHDWPWWRRMVQVYL